MAPKTKKSRWSFGLLEIDSMIDDTLYRCGAVLKQSYDGFTVFMDRFGVVGVKRIAVEFASDGLTFAVLGGMLLLALPNPPLNTRRSIGAARRIMPSSFWIAPVTKSASAGSGIQSPSGSKIFPPIWFRRLWRRRIVAFSNISALTFLAQRGLSSRTRATLASCRAARH